MSLRVTIKSTDLRERTKKATGEIFAYEQVGYAWLCGRDGKPEEYPTKITITHWVRNGRPETPAYEPGEYTLSPASFEVAEYGELKVHTPRLVRVAAQATARAA